ncbi:3'(2'),5'-bisphosphate nucleotidase CysQ [Aureimonas populi]|uniref:3'(2'),5'-bisphosphate nucleotidase CysQ n=1 Tax=Aureimonas populi TaxID=1701758 RepID=A0ABW5CHL3_9HYPH|nr:3'(2'),5'-bisphosphate nucleotidase CysQ [Aureimonas populi]
MSAYAADLALLTRAAREAGTIAMSYFRRDPQVFWKEGNSPVSEADLAVDGFLRDFLLSARARYGWVSEETASEPAYEGENRFFVIDPIDGTRSFLRGEATWCVSLAVVENGRPVVGVIDVPVAAQVFTATADGPAMLNRQPFDMRVPEGPLRVSLPDRVRRSLSPEVAGELDIRESLPSLAYRLALVASGRFDGTIVQPRANDWDIAAADLLLHRSGGALLTAEGKQHLYKLHPRRHGLLVAGADHALDRLRAVAATLEGDAPVRRPDPTKGHDEHGRDKRR